MRPQLVAARSLQALSALGGIALIGGCATLGKVMSPYSETFSCKNSDHGQCIDPAQAHDDAVAGVPSRSNPAVTREKALLGGNRLHARKGTRQAAAPYAGYRDSVYRELQGLIDAPETPMLREGRTVRTLILPYADRGRPDRLYMPRYVYSILESPQWIVGDYLVNPPPIAPRVPVLQQARDRGPNDAPDPGDAGDLGKVAGPAAARTEMLP